MIFEQEKSPSSCVAKGWFDMGNVMQDGMEC